MVAPVTAGLVSDLAAATMGDDDGSNVYAWYDSSPDTRGNALYSDGDYAIYRRNMTPNGGPAIRFSSVAYNIQNGWIFDTATSAEYFAVIRNDGSPNNPGFYQFGGGDYTYYTFSDGNIYDGSFTNTRFGFPGITPGDWHIYNVSHDGTTRTTRIDGVVVHTATVAFTAPSQTANPTCRIGRQFSNYPWRGDMAELLAYNRSLNSAERTSVYNYLRSAHFTAVGSAPTSLDLPPVAVTVGFGSQVSVSDPVIPPPSTIALPPVTVTVRTGVDSTEPQLLLLDALRVTVGVQLDATGPVVAPELMPAVMISIALIAPTLSDASITLSAPPDGAVLASAYPQFMIGLQAADDTLTYTIEVQYAADADFTAPITLDAQVPVTDGGAIIDATDAAPQIAYWRARLLLDGVEQSGWTVPFAFTVSTAVSTTVLPLSWMVDAGADRPVHVWHFDPPGATTGDPVTVFGQGFPASGTVLVGDDPVTVDTWQRVAATGITDDSRVIDGPVIDCEHFAVTFVAPLVDGPGDALTVEA